MYRVYVEGMYVGTEVLNAEYVRKYEESGALLIKVTLEEEGK